MSSTVVNALGVLLLLLAVRQSAADRVEDVQCAAKCTSDLDCSLNGACNVGSGICACNAAWTGPCCAALNLLPVSSRAFGYRHENTSTWGGNIIQDAQSLYHMWIAEMAPESSSGSGSCGLTTWGQNSQVTHVTSSTPTGPYARQEVAVPIWSHNPLVRKMPDGTLVMYHIGSGGGGAPPKGYCGRNATSPCGEQSFDKCGPPADGCTTAKVSGWTCHAGACSGDDAQAAPAGDCGADIAEPTLACDSFATCAPAAAAACDSQSGCVSFGLSSAWGFGKAKLFSAGTGGLTPNAEWNVWIKGADAAAAATAIVADVSKSSADGSYYLDMYGRAKSAGTHPGTAAAQGLAEGAPCTLQLHVSHAFTGPWAKVSNVTISPCGGNNPAPWVHPNGTVFIVFTDNNMGLWSAPTWQGPYSLVTSGACGGGEVSDGRFLCV